MIFELSASVIVALTAYSPSQTAETASKNEGIPHAADVAPESTSRPELPDGDYKIDGEEIRCKYLRPVDSRIPKKICQSVAEWEARKKMQEDEMRSGKNSNSTCASEGPC